MKIYDYRQELITLLENTSSDPASLLQTQRSLTTILNILNHYAGGQGSHPAPAVKKPRFHQHQVNRDQQPLPTAAKKQLKSLLTGPAKEVTDAKPVVHVRPAENKAAAPKEITEEERLAADNRYLVHRKLSGAEINHRYYSEAILHHLSFPVEDGDIVELDTQQTVRGLPAIRRVTSDHLTDYQPEKINVLEYSKLTTVPGSDVLQISSTMKENSILDAAPANTVVVDPFKYPGRDLKAGMVIDYAYYDRGNGL
jgi:hypothetical protein